MIVSVEGVFAFVYYTTVATRPSTDGSDWKSKLIHPTCYAVMPSLMHLLKKRRLRVIHLIPSINSIIPSFGEA